MLLISNVLLFGYFVKPKDTNTRLGYFVELRLSLPYRSPDLDPPGRVGIETTLDPDIGSAVL